MMDGNKIDAKEVLMYLNQLGYTNISAHVLKDFLTDLKRLMKSCDKQNKNNDFLNETALTRETIYRNLPSKSNSNSFKPSQPQKVSEEDQEINKFGKPTNRVRQISLHVLKNINKISHEHCVHVEEICECDNKSNSKESKPEILESTSKITIASKDSNPTECTSKTSIPSKGSKPSNRSSRQRGGACKPNKSINRKDPVALYHYYQSEWKKVKFPGEEEHALLRRMVRKKLQSEQLSKKC